MTNEEPIERDRNNVKTNMLVKKNAKRNFIK